MPWEKQRPVCQLYIVLLGIEPKIWRRFQVSSNITLDRLHDVIQVIMGWEDCHLHQFIVGEKFYGMPMDDGPMIGPPMKDESGARLRQIISNEGDRFSYEYDFGDSWEHRLEVEKILPAKEAEETPVCLDGEMACPPEDCGGRFGFSRILQYFENPEEIELEEPVSRMVEGFDPEDFDLEEVNDRLSAFR
ncbi:hypothetical protein AKJ51_00765 [candidate division MSBL1 archaeon SCGC-AAA382A20]|uniref:Plasmid pRiA4b Orf3-like domain-containing protein n=1 Tax=candidate division MSBL1 archaeon SCGC-AAA382A20 TaxID=1698280 RepID=A0A133VMK3_9EURY|nr:hypothetical protein AKJ51_00765 [candidate division MSBL1 archaeon SCGC-AAA382A20]